MEILEAVKVLQIENLDTLDFETLKRRYKKLMRKYHPDLNPQVNEDKCKLLNDAYEVIKSAREQLDKLKLSNLASRDTQNNIKPAVVINLGQLLRVYKGESIKAFTKGTVVDINKQTKNKYRLYIKIEGNLLLDGVYIKYNGITPWVFNDNYEIECEIPVEDMDMQIVSKISFYDKEIKFTIPDDKTSVKLKMTIGDSINLGVRVIKHWRSEKNG